VRILFACLSVVLLSACSQLQFTSMFGHVKNPILSHPLSEQCELLPYDNTESVCNLYGWQSFAYHSLLQTKAEQQYILSQLGSDFAATNKRLILLTHSFQKLDVRQHAAETMLEVAKQNNNAFGQFFYLLANHTMQAIQSQKSAQTLEFKVKELMQKNRVLSVELKNSQEKIEAIMDIEKKLNTN